VRDRYCVKGIILTGGITPYKTIMRLVKRTNIPIIMVKETTYETARRLNNLIVKLRPEDTDKIKRATSLIKKYVDIEGIISKVKEIYRKRA
jgi:BioD-like phosphotransacetylase family protein